MIAGLEAARSGDWRRCLDELLVAWREYRSPALAELIAKVGKRAATSEVRPTKPELMKRIATLATADITPVCDAIARQFRVSPAMRAIGVELAGAAEPDPRIAAMLDVLFADGVNDGMLVAAIVRHDDPRFHEHLRDISEMWTRRTSTYEALGREIQAHLRTAHAALPIDDLSGLDALLDRPTDLPTLLDAVYADLPNDIPRQIYADALQDVGDPRGEFIALQLASTNPKRERALGKTHERGWLGTIEPWLQKSGVVWKRGFPIAGRLPERWEGALTQNGAWHTFEELDLGLAWGQELVRWLVAQPSLRRVRRFHANDLELLPEGVPWTHVGLRHADQDHARLLQVFPRLEELDLSDVPLDEAVSLRDALLTHPVRIRLSVRSFEQPPTIRA
ncbi:MAG TPA: TIGR02996 domain-containing protein, partial [Kofleriaceae bacterium]